jgi:hypothetical protein
MIGSISTNNELRLNENDFSNFGRYLPKDKLVLTLPNNTITLSRLGDGRFSYARQTTQNELVKKIIRTKSENFDIELAPVLPIHMPSYKTDFFFLRFTEPLYISQNTATEVLASFPIELGIFLIEENQSGGIDYFSCDPFNSRFALYGPTEDGKLCKYAKTSLDEKQIVNQPFIHAQLKIQLINELEEGTSIGKIVFPVTDHDLYFHGTDVMMDGLEATIKNRVGLHVVEMIQKPITNLEGWKLAPRDTKKTDYKFSMEKGFD